MAGELSEHVGFDVRGGVATLELRRPEKRNALTADMLAAIVTHLDAASGDPEIRALVVQGAGGAFTGGADLSAVKNADGSAAKPYKHLAVTAIEAIAAFPVPTLAKVEGPCIGAGCSIAVACDQRFVMPGATFRIPAVRHRIVYDENSIARLVALVGPSRAARMLYAAEPVTGKQALRIGLADECTEDLDTAASLFLEAVLLGDAATIAATRRILRGFAR